jgi:hypothetical protein
VGEGEEARAMVEGKLLIRARLNACLGSHFPCRSSPWPKEDERDRERAGGRAGGQGKMGGCAGATEDARSEGGTRRGGTTERRRRREGRA